MKWNVGEEKREKKRKRRERRGDLYKCHDSKIQGGGVGITSFGNTPRWNCLIQKYHEFVILNQTR